jgi:hypothetical protein
MNQDLNLSSLANLQSSFNQSWNLIKLHDAGLAEYSFGSNFGNLINNFLGPIFASLGDIVHYDICTSLSKLKGNACTDAPDMLSADWSDGMEDIMLPRGSCDDGRLALE